MSSNKHPCPPWHALPTELLRAVFDRVPAKKDKSNLLSVCKCWRVGISASIHSLSLPWPPLDLSHGEGDSALSVLGESVREYEEHCKATTLPGFVGGCPFGAEPGLVIREALSGEGPSPPSPAAVFAPGPATSASVAASLKLFTSVEEVRIEFSTCSQCQASSFSLTPQVLTCLSLHPQMHRLVCSPTVQWSDPRFCPFPCTRQHMQGQAATWGNTLLTPIVTENPNSANLDNAPLHSGPGTTPDPGPATSAASAFRSFTGSCTALRELRLCTPVLNWHPLPATSAGTLSLLQNLTSLFVGLTFFQPHSLKPYTSLRSLQTLAAPLLNSTCARKHLPLLTPSLHDLTLFPLSVRPEFAGFSLEDDADVSTGMDDEWDHEWALPRSVTVLTQLTSLCLSSASAMLRVPEGWEGEVPHRCFIPSLKELRNLKGLHLGDIPFLVLKMTRGPGCMSDTFSLSPHFEFPPSLSSLSLSSLSLEHLPRSISSLLSFHTLTLYDSNIRSLDTLVHLSSLTSLVIDRSRGLPSLPSSPSSFPPKLKILSVSGYLMNPVELRPLSSISTLTSLHLSIGRTDVTFSEAHSRLTSLSRCSLAFPSFQGAHHLVSLRQLSVSWLEPARTIPPLPPSLHSLSLSCSLPSLHGLASARDNFTLLSSLSLSLLPGGSTRPTSPTLLSSLLGGTPSLSSLSITLSPNASWSHPFPLSLPPMPKLKHLTATCHGIDIQDGFFPNLSFVKINFFAPPGHAAAPFDRELGVLLGIEGMKWVCVVNARLSNTPVAPLGVRLHMVEGNTQIEHSCM